MSSNVTTLVSSIKARMASVLGATYSELAYGIDLSRNSFNGNFKRYGLMPSSMTETSSVTRYVTIDQTFDMILCDSFINVSMSDSAEQAKGPALQDLAYDIYRDLVSTKAGSSSIVINVSEFSTAAPETIEDKAVVLKASFKIKYRITI